AIARHSIDRRALAINDLEISAILSYSWSRAQYTSLMASAAYATPTIITTAVSSQRYLRICVMAKTITSPNELVSRRRLRYWQKWVSMRVAEVITDRNCIFVSRITDTPKQRPKRNVPPFSA